MTAMFSDAEQAKRDVLAVHSLAFVGPGRRFADNREGWKVSPAPGRPYLGFGLTEDEAWIWAAKIMQQLRLVDRLKPPSPAARPAP